MQKLTLIIAVIIAVALSLSLYIGYVASNPDLPLPAPAPASTERISIQGVAYNCSQNSISAYVQLNSRNETILNNAIVKSSLNGEVVAAATMFDTISDYKLHCVTFNLNTTLPSGNYTLTLTTIKGGSFISSKFNVP